MAFYRDVLGLHRIERPPFNNVGAWMASGTLEIHLTVNNTVRYRPAPVVDTGEVHFAARLTDFKKMVGHLESLGFSDKLPSGNPKQIVFRLEGPAPYLQLYIVDPDNHVIEMNDAALKTA
jgi:catechol 2,3-dioxygenase-like lactoylglutathione lyase family enzyme